MDTELEEFKDHNPIYVMDRNTKEIIKLPNLPSGYSDNSETLNNFIKGLFNSKYFIG